MLSDSLKPALVEHSDEVRGLQRLHEKDVALGFGKVYLADVLGRKLPGAATEWGQQYVFPSSAFSVDPRSGVRRRHHAHEGSMSREVTKAVRDSGVVKRATSHSLAARL